MNRTWLWGFVLGIGAYWAFQHFAGMGVTGKGKAAG